MRVSLVIAATSVLGSVPLGACTSPAPPALDAATTVDAHAPAPRTPGFAGFALPGPGERRYDVRAEVIEDAITGLVWEAGPSTELRSLEAARARCASLALDGSDDFRVPSRIELATLLVPARSPTIDPAFAMTQAEYHWTSSLHPLRDTSATTIYFGAAEIVFALVRDPSAIVRCVRGGSGEGAGPSRRADGAVVDEATRLRWEVLDARVDHAGAVEGCASRGMRLPTLDELASLVDDTRSAPAIDLATLGGEAGATWSDTVAQSAGERLGLDLSLGPSVRLRETELAWARCVAEVSP